MNHKLDGQMVGNLAGCVSEMKDVFLEPDVHWEYKSVTAEKIFKASSCFSVPSQQEHKNTSQIYVRQ